MTYILVSLVPWKVLKKKEKEKKWKAHSHHVSCSHVFQKKNGWVLLNISSFCCPFLYCNDSTVIEGRGIRPPKFGLSNEKIKWKGKNGKDGNMLLEGGWGWGQSPLKSRLLKAPCPHLTEYYKAFLSLWSTCELYNN